MRFPNAALGVKRIFTAEILSLLAAILGALTVMGAAFTAGVSRVAIASSGNVASGASLASLGFTAIFGIATLVLTVIAFFMKLFGVNKANADESSFGIAFALILISLVLSIISAFLTGTIGSVLNILSQILNLIITWAIVNGIRNLAVRLSDSAMEAQGKTVFTLLLCSYGLSIVAKLISLFAPAFASVLSVVALILQLVYYVLYLIFLSRAKKMLGA